MEDQNVFAGAFVDRSGERRKDPDWLAEALSNSETRFVPVWGDRYATKARNAAEKIAHPLLRDQDNTEALVFGRITSLVGYLESIQVE